MVFRIGVIPRGERAQAFEKGSPFKGNQRDILRHAEAMFQKPARRHEGVFRMGNEHRGRRGLFPKHPLEAVADPLHAPGMLDDAPLRGSPRRKGLAESRLFLHFSREAMPAHEENSMPMSQPQKDPRRMACHSPQIIIHKGQPRFGERIAHQHRMQPLLAKPHLRRSGGSRKDPIIRAMQGHKFPQPDTDPAPSEGRLSHKIKPDALIRKFLTGAINHHHSPLGNAIRSVGETQHCPRFHTLPATS